MNCNTDVSKLGFKAKTTNALKRNDVNTLSELLALTPNQIKNFRMIGLKGLTDIYFSLKKNAGIIVPAYEAYIGKDVNGDNSNPQGYASGYKTFHNLEKAKNHFKTRYCIMTDIYPFDIWSRFGVASGDWDAIRKLTCHMYGVSVVQDISSEDLEGANMSAINLIDQLFATNNSILQEKANIQ